MISTAHDYATFLEALRNGGALGKVRILSPHAVELMTTNQLGDIKKPNGLGFGYGFETSDKYGPSGMESVGSWGWGGAYGTYYHVDPQERLVTVMMIQLLPNTTDFADKFKAYLPGVARLNAAGTCRCARDSGIVGRERAAGEHALVAPRAVHEQCHGPRSPVSTLRGYPAVDLGFQHFQRNRAVLQHFVVEGGNAEFRAQRLFCALAQLRRS